jgi:uncharacterized protein (DUF934 family)
MHRVLRRREIVADAWRDWSAGALLAGARDDLIVPWSELSARAAECIARAAPLAVRIAPADKIEQLQPYLAALALVAVEFPSAGEGRGYTQGRLLRTRLGFKGELRAVGAAVKRDLIVPLARCGFDAFDVAPGESLEECLEALHRYSVAYQADPQNSLSLRWRMGSVPR